MREALRALGEDFDHGVPIHHVELHLEADGLEAGQVFKDLDESGGKSSRPAFDRMLARIEAGQSGGVIVWNLRRFGRRVVNVVRDVRQIEEWGRHVHLV